MEAVRLQGKQLTLWDNALCSLQVRLRALSPAAAMCHRPYFRTPSPSPSQMLRDAADCDVDGSAYAQVRASRQLALLCRAQAACTGRRCSASRHAAFAFASWGSTKEVVAEARVWGNPASAAAPWLFRRR